MVGYCAIAAAPRLAAAMRVRRRHYNAPAMTSRSPSLLASILLHGAIVAAVAWWVPAKRGGMPGEGEESGEFSALLLDEPAQSSPDEEITADVTALAFESFSVPEVQTVVDLPTPSAVTINALVKLPAPSVGVQDLALAKPLKKPSRPAGSARRLNQGTSGSGGGGEGGNGKYTPPRYAHCPAPDYPPAARAAHQSGVTLLSVSVDDHGAVVRVSLTRSSGSRILDIAALAAVRKWKFVPAHLKATPVAAEVEVPVRFVL